MSNKNDTNVSAGGISFCGLLFIVFLVLKLLNVIDWSWWWVAAPLWVPAALVFAILAVTILAASIINRK